MISKEDEIVGGIEAGGTKFVCAIGNGPGEGIRAKEQFNTTDDPEETLNRVVAWFNREQSKYGAVKSIGIGSFGPVDLKVGSKTYGYITSTPKLGWVNYDIVGKVSSALNVPVGFDTDVNGAALGEHRWGAARGINNFVYVTVGTGIGVGGLMDGRPLHGLLHPEMGHIFIPHDRTIDPFEGVCPYHKDCWEGLASGPSIKARWGIGANELDIDHPAWNLLVNYIAYGLVNITCTLSPERIIVGGGVSKGGKLGQERLFEMVRARFLKILNGYIQTPAITENIKDYIVPPGLGDEAGVCGAIALGQQKSVG
jgi:fructokinase